MGENTPERLEERLEMGCMLDLIFGGVVICIAILSGYGPLASILVVVGLYFVVAIPAVILRASQSAK